MSKTDARRPIVIVAALAASAALVLSACGSSSSGAGAGATAAGPAASSSADATLAAMLPAKIKSAGVVNVATDASYAPIEFFASDNKTIQGMDIDLGHAIGDVLGVKFNFVNASFDTIIPSLGTRYDLSMSAFTDNVARQQKVDMVDYFSAGVNFLVQKGKNPDLTSLAALCGKHVAVEKGTVQLDQATAQSKVCTAKGNAAIDVQAYPDQNGANLALNSGRADVVLADSPVNSYAAKQSNGALEVIGTSYGTAPYGIPVPKGADYAGFATAIKGALEKLNADGTYAQILKKWGVEAGAISSFTINGATS
jgi:polar amino acid transport system substrate-binding protein